MKRLSAFSTVGMGPNPDSRSLRVLILEFSGLRAGVGYPEVGTGITLHRRPRSAMISRAKPAQDMYPSLQTW